MPPSRRKSSNPRSAQQTLAFGPRTSANKVTKPTLPPSSSKKLDKPVSDTLVKASSEEVSTPEPLPEDIPSADEVKEEEEEVEQPRELAIREQPPARTEAEQKASKVSEVQIKKYWKAKEDERKAPRGTFAFPLPLSPRCHPNDLIANPLAPSPPRIPHRPRKGPPPLRPLLPIRPLHRPPAAEALEAG